MFDTLDHNLELKAGYGGRYLHGTVVNNQDPLNRDRIQVRIPSLYDPDEGEIPWIGPAKVSPFGVAKDWGVYGAPAVNSDVLVLLQDGNPHYPMYVAGLQRYANSEFVSGTHWGFKDPQGNKFRVNLVTKEVIFEAAAGVNIVITPNGQLSVFAVGPATLTAPSFTMNGDVHTIGALTNNGVNVGSDHVHADVKTGSDISGVPV